MNPLGCLKEEIQTIFYQSENANMTLILVEEVYLEAAACITKCPQYCSVNLFFIGDKGRKISYY
jgi:hypothetical protein